VHEYVFRTILLISTENNYQKKGNFTFFKTVVKTRYFSVAARPVSAGVVCIWALLFGLAAAGFTIFQGGRAGFPVADLSFVRFVFLTACAGVFIDASPPGGG
jgi:hypothetical protein